MPDVKRQVKLVTEQRPIDKPSPMEGYPMRSWSIEIYLLDAQGNTIPANIFDKVTYKLHPSFEKRATQVVKKPPFRIAEEGWGEFDMEIIFTGAHKGGDHPIPHDLNFQQSRYESKHTITFRNPKPDLLALLQDSGPTGQENGVRAEGGQKKKAARKDKNVDMEKLADGLQRLDEDSLLQVVQMIHDHKSNETYTKNDVESEPTNIYCFNDTKNGEFHVDLYTLPDNLVKQLWDFTAAKTDL